MKRTTNSSLILMAAVFAVSVGITSCGEKKTAQPAKAKEAEAEQIYAINTYKIKAGNLDDYLEFGGDIASVNAVDVMPDQAGKVTRVLVSVGDKVKKGQTIAYVNPLRAGAVYNDSPVTSPIDGRITSLPAQLGATVSQVSPLARVARTDDLEVKINIAERFISRISERQNAVVTFDAYPGIEFNAKVFEVSPVLDTATRTMGVKLRFNKADSRVKVGMYGRVKLVTESVKNAIVIPNSCIVTRDNKHYVFLLNSELADGTQTVKLQPVTIGISVDGNTEITNGLSVGDLIVSKGQSLLNDGSKVKDLSK